MPRDAIVHRLAEHLTIHCERCSARTAARSAHSSSMLPSRRISALSRPCALVMSMDLKVLLQTSSARRSEPWAASSPPAASRSGSRPRRARRGPTPPPSRRARRRPRSRLRPRTRSRQRHLFAAPAHHILCPHFRHTRVSPRPLLHRFSTPDPLALRAGLGHRPVPGGEIARGIAHAAPERLAALGAPLGQVTDVALRALHAQRNGARALAGRDTWCRPRNSPKRPVLMTIGEPQRWHFSSVGRSGALSFRSDFT